MYLSRSMVIGVAGRHLKCSRCCACAPLHGRGVGSRSRLRLSSSRFFQAGPSERLSRGPALGCCSTNLSDYSLILKCSLKFTELKSLKVLELLVQTFFFHFRTLRVHSLRWLDRRGRHGREAAFHGRPAARGRAGGARAAHDAERAARSEDAPRTSKNIIQNE